MTITMTLTFPRPPTTSHDWLQVRGFALGVATLVNRVTSGTVALTFLSLSRALTPAGAYYAFAGLAVCACAFISKVRTITHRASDLCACVCMHASDSVSYTHLTLPTICSV